MKHIITITGNAGTGKDTIARILSDIAGWNVVVSYTTRPMREGEVNGREHHFINTPNNSTTDKDSIQNVLAYTLYGGYEYWTTWDQISDTHPTVYVIDEKGLLDLLEARAEGKAVKLTTIHVTTNKEIRLMRGVTLERIQRDETRDRRLEYFKYDFEIKNDKSLKALEHKLRDIVQTITA